MKKIKQVEQKVETKDENTNETNLHSLLKSRLSVAKKWCKKPHDAWKKWISEYEIDDISDTEEVRDRVRIGYLFRKIESDQPSIFDDQPELIIKGRRPQSQLIEPLIDGTYDYLWDIQNLEEKIEDVGLYFSLLGMGIIESPWVTKTKKVTEPVLDESGQPVMNENGEPVVKEYEVPIVDNPMAKASNPFKVYFSPETEFSPVLDYEHCPYLFKEEVITSDEIKSKYKKTVESSETMNLGDTDTDQEIESDLSVVKDDLKRVTTYKYYGCLPEDQAKEIVDAEGNPVPWTYDKEYFVLLTKNEVIKAEECPYDGKPFFLVGNYGLANRFWKFGDAKHLMPLVQEYQAYRTQILTHTRKLANPKPLIPTTTNVDESNFRSSKSGVPVKYDGVTPPSYLNPPPLGAEVQVGVNVVKSDLERTAGSFDLSGGGSESTVKTPRGIQVFSEAADKNIRRKRKKIARLIRQLIIFQFKQIAQNWKPEDAKTIAIVNPDSGESSNESVTAEVLNILDGVNLMYNIDIEIESMSVNRVQEKQDALNLWESAQAHPEIFNLVEVAKDLLQNGYGKKDAKRFLLSEEDRKKLSAPQPDKPKVSVSIKADAGTPEGNKLLENEGLIAPGSIPTPMVDTNPLVEDTPITQPDMSSNMSTQLPPGVVPTTQTNAPIEPQFQ